MRSLYVCRSAARTIGLAASLTAALAWPAGEARASAFQLREGDPDWLANAFAGIDAKAYDAGTAWNNPAGMTRLDSSEIDQGINYFDPGIRFSGQDLVNGQPVTGSTGGDAAPSAVTGGFEAVWSYSPDLKFGLAVEVPYGLRTVFPQDFVGRYQSLVSAIDNFQFAPSVAYRLSPQLSIGGGPILSYMHARLTQAINVTAFVPPNTASPIADIHGDGYAAGYQFGALYEVNSSLRLGIDYKSREDFKLSGQQRVTVAPVIRLQDPFVTAVLDDLNADITSKIALPDVATISGYYDVNAQWAIMATAQWTHWSLIPDITVRTPTSAEVTPVGFNDTWLESIGANWRPRNMPSLLLQTGLLFDHGANTDFTRGPRLPDEARIGPTIGFTYDITPRMRFRMAYLHEFGAGGTRINYTNNFPSSGTLIGNFNDNADVTSVGLTYKF